MAPSDEPVVVIDDESAMRLSCRQILARMGHPVETYGDGAQGLAGIAASKPGLVIVDLMMPGLSGLEVIRRIHEIDPSIVVVVITGYATVETAIEAMKAGAYDFLPKPFTPDQLRVIVGRGLERRRLEIASRTLEIEREMLRRRFVSFVSHQLKSPLAAIHQYLDVLERLAGDPEVEAKRGEWIHRSLQRTVEMKALIGDWLTLSRIEGDALVARRDPVDLDALLARLVDAQRDRAAAVPVTLTLAPPRPGEPHVVAGDETALGVLFENLIDNALKYNRSHGTVDVEAALERGEVVVAVRDSGVGVPAEALPFLFDEFFRARTEGAAKVRGSGLGLAICRRITQQLGGSIGVESSLGEGTTFRVRLPVHVTAPAEAAGDDAASATPATGSSAAVLSAPAGANVPAAQGLAPVESPR